MIAIMTPMAVMSMFYYRPMIMPNIVIVVMTAPVRIRVPAGIPIFRFMAAYVMVMFNSMQLLMNYFVLLTVLGADFINASLELMLMMTCEFLLAVTFIKISQCRCGEDQQPQTEY